MTDNSKDETKLITLVEDGDIILAVDGPKGKRRYLASSHTLKIASRYFRAMFQPSFPEGQKLFHSSTPCVIELKENHWSCMYIIFKVLHHKTASIPRCISQDSLVPLAAHCNKYDVCEALSGWMNKYVLALRNTIKDSTESEIFADFVSTAVLLQDDDMFRESALHLAMNCVWKREYTLPEGIPNRVQIVLSTSRQKTFLKITEALEDMITGVLQKRVTLGKFMWQLSGSKLWPFSKFPFSFSVKGVGAELETVCATLDKDNEINYIFNDSLSSFAARISQIIAASEAELRTQIGNTKDAGRIE